jgi:NTE family protein
MADLLDKLPEEPDRRPEAALLRKVADRKVYNIVHLNYRPKDYEGPAKDHEFSRRSMNEHWRAGYYDAVRTLRHREVLEQPANQEGVLTFDLAVDGRE